MRSGISNRFTSHWQTRIFGILSRGTLHHLTDSLRTYPATFFTLVLLLTGQTVRAAETSLYLAISHENNTYQTNLTATINTHPDKLFKLLTTYKELYKLSQLIQRSELQAGGELLLELESCFAFICFNKKQVMSMTTSPYTVTGTIVPEQSDFSSGWARWHISKFKDGSKIFFKSEMTPKFWVPPFIGPWLIKQKLEDEALYSIRFIENHITAK